MNSTSQKTVAFITPRYVEASAGGAEVACRFFAEKLTLIKGIPAEILTTCAEDHYSWKNFHQPGEFKKNDVTVRRFPADDRKNPDMYGAAAVKLEAKKKLSLEEEDFIFNNNINSQALYEFIRRHQKDYAFFIFTPYLFGTTVNGTKICPEKTLIRPCFHNEPYARTLRVKEMFRRVRGILCNSPPERDLVLKMTGISPEKTFLVGEAVETACLPSEEDILSRFSIRSPYLFYCGRREPGKNFPLLLEMFREYKKQNRNPLQLVTAGSRYVEIL
ncbi:MAG: hypothetical protein JW928_08505, partial [Candidatus Aureabacteria bacterium]|nr:hypothetical protein [Candidatus Auribacterota bacterium]